jgi:hypothetical protein
MKQNNNHRPQWAVRLIGLMVAAAAYPASASPVADDFESTLAKWQTSGA